VPIAIAVLFSFNQGKSQAAWQGFSWRWYFKDPVNSVLHDPHLHAAVIQTVRLSVLTTVIAVPLGEAFALGINRWRGYPGTRRPPPTWAPTASRSCAGSCCCWVRRSSPARCRCSPA
jgi:ABC-type Fe3+ transport system permease subunit